MFAMKTTLDMLDGEKMYDEIVAARRDGLA